MAKRIKSGDPRIAIGYLRVSTDEQRLGPEAQRASIEAWATREGVSVVAWHVDAGVSGAAEVSERPALVRALAALRELGAGMLVAAKRDRLGRDPVIVAVIEREARAAGAFVRTADGASDGADDDEGAVLRRGVEDLFSKVERLRIKKRTILALAVKKARGERTGSVPFGFKLAADGVRLERDEREACIVERARELRASGASTRAIVRALAFEGVTSPRSGRALNQTQVVRVLRVSQLRDSAA